MAKYSEGYITIEGGSNIVYGTDGVAFIANVTVGSALVIRGIQTPYIIIRVINDWTLQLDRSIDGTNTVSGVNYSISTDFTPILNLPIPSAHSVNTHAQMKRALEILDLEIPKILHSPPNGQI